MDAFMDAFYLMFHLVM